jgi:hypothetical protein
MVAPGLLGLVLLACRRGPLGGAPIRLWLRRQWRRRQLDMGDEAPGHPELAVVDARFRPLCMCKDASDHSGVGLVQHYEHAHIPCECELRTDTNAKT